MKLFDGILLALFALCTLPSCGEYDSLHDKSPAELKALWREADGETQARLFRRLTADKWLPGLLEEVSQVSGLPVRRNVPMTFITKANRSDILADIAAAAEDSERLRHFSAGVKAAGPALGLDNSFVDFGGDPEDGEESEGVPPTLLGLYVPAKQRFYLVEGQPPESQLHTIRHELVHALQDQFLPLDEYLDTRLSDFDTFIAGKSVVEGQAEFVATLATLWRGNIERVQALNPFNMFEQGTQMARFVLPHSLFTMGLHLDGCHRSGLRGRSLFGQHDDFDRGEVESPEPSYLYFQYIQGQQFVIETAGAKMRGSLQAWMRQTLAQPPATTREVLHPEVYLSKLGLEQNALLTEPLTLAALSEEALAAPLLWQSALGELSVQIYGHRQRASWLAAHLEQDCAFVVKQPNTSVPATLWLTRWDTARHAAAFATIANGQQKFLGGRHKDSASDYRSSVLIGGNVVGVLTDFVHANTQDEAGQDFAGRLQQQMRVAVASNATAF